MTLYKQSAPGNTVSIDNFDINPAMRIFVLVLEGVFDTGLTTVLDGLTMANKLASATGMAAAGFDITVVGIGSGLGGARC